MGKKRCSEIMYHGSDQGATSLGVSVDGLSIRYLACVCYLHSLRLCKKEFNVCS